MHIKNWFLLTLLGGWFSSGLWAQTQDEIQLLLNSEGFPEMELQVDRRLPVGPELSPDNWQILENGEAVALTSIALQPGEEGINVALVFDHSTGWAGTSYSWKQVHKAVRQIVQGFRPEKDSLMLIGYGEEVDMISELTDNYEMLEIILGTAQEVTGQALAEAIETAVAGLAPSQGKKAIIILSSGYSGATWNRPIEDLPFFLIAPRVNHQWRTLAWRSGGLFQELEPIIKGDLPAQEIAGWPYSTSLLRFQTDLDPGQDRTIELYANSVSSEPLGSIRVEGTSDELLAIAEPIGKSDSPAWVWYIVGGVGALVILGLLWRSVRFRTSRNLVQPAITDLAYDAKRKRVKAKIDIPQRKKPAKFTLHNHSGTPIRDRIIPGTSRRVVLDVSDIGEGIYLCSLSNAGQTSEMREFVLGSSS